MNFEYIYKVNDTIVGEKAVRFYNEKDSIMFESEFSGIGVNFSNKILCDQNYYPLEFEQFLKTVNTLNKSHLVRLVDGRFKDKYSEVEFYYKDRFFVNDQLIHLLPKVDQYGQFHRIYDMTDGSLISLRSIKKSDYCFNLLVPEYAYLEYDNSTQDLLYYENFISRVVMEIS